MFVAYRADRVPEADGGGARPKVINMPPGPGRRPQMVSKAPGEAAGTEGAAGVDVESRPQPQPAQAAHLNLADGGAGKDQGIGPRQLQPGQRGGTFPDPGMLGE